ncbi:MAG: hypothetical protein ACKOX6_00835 [Bdellovibrio sp.]
MAQAEKKVKFLEVTSIVGGLKFTFGNGMERRIVFSDFNQSINEQARAHGFNQKLRDTTAGFSKEWNYDGALEKFDATLQGMLDGEWNRSGGGVAGQQMKDLAAAIAEIRSVDIDRAMAAVTKAEPDQRKAWMKNASIAKIMARIALERAESAESDDVEGDGLDIEL